MIIFFTTDHQSCHLIYSVFLFTSTESSHKKLLVNAEKTVGAQINNAETKIAEVQKVGWKQVSKLTYALLTKCSSLSDTPAESPEEDEWPEIRAQGADYRNCRLTDRSSFTLSKYISLVQRLGSIGCTLETRLGFHFKGVQYRRIMMHLGFVRNWVLQRLTSRCP